MEKSVASLLQDRSQPDLIDLLRSKKHDENCNIHACDLKKGSDCSSCQIYCTIIRRYCEWIHIDPEKVWINFGSGDFENGSYFSLNGSSLPESPDSHQLQFCFEPGYQGSNSLDNCSLPLRISGDTGSEAAFQWARKHLDDCMANHRQHCRRPLHPRRLPLRLLDLEYAGLNNPRPFIRICKLDSSSSGNKYACLSHCWGPSELHPPKLLRDNEDTYSAQGIPMSNLPLSFKEAISFTLRLGINYLWIDSLCIRQDDPSEAESEIKRMDEIYENCEITLAIAKSKSSQEGCFTKSLPEYSGCPLVDGVVSNKLRKIFIRRNLFHIDVLSHIVMRATEYGFPLMTRAWTLQEAALPTRVLYFGPQELLWECRSHSCCECGDQHVSEYYRGRQSSGWSYNTFRSLLSSYISRDLTFQSDRSAAFLGVASRFERHFNDEFVAGMMKRTHLPLSLSWYASWPTSNANPFWPSWSWLSVSGARGTQITNEYPDPDIRLSACSFEIKSFAPGTPSFPSSRRAPYYLEINGPLITGIWNGSPPGAYEKPFVQFPWGSIIVKDIYFDAKLEESWLHHNGEETLCAILFTNDKFVKYGRGIQCHMIILRRINSSEQFYKRLGKLYFNECNTIDWEFYFKREKRRKIIVL